MSIPPYGEKTSIPNPVRVLLYAYRASGGSGGEGAPMVYADNVKDWNNLVLTKDFLDLLGEDPDDVRHALCRLPQKPDEDILPTGSTGHPKYLTKYPGKTGDVLTAIRKTMTYASSVCPRYT